MNIATLETLARFADLAEAYLARSAEPCRDDHGRFASCGIGDAHERRQRRRAAGKHRRQNRRRKPKGREHAGWIRHFRGEDRELGRDIKRERRQLRREHRKELRQQRRDARRAIRDMHREYPRSGARRGSATRQNVADQIRNDRAALREDHAAARAQQRADHLSTVESHHRDQRESHADVLREVRRNRQDEREAAGKAWRGKAVSPIGEIPTAHDLAERAARRIGMLDGWRDGTLTGREALDVLHALRLECRAILRGWAADLVESLNPDYQRPAKGLGGKAKAAVGKFFGKVRGFIREAFVAGVLTLTGPHFDVMANKPVNDAVAAAVIEQEKYLAAFEQETLEKIEAAKPRPAPPAGEPPTPEEETGPPLDGTFVARAEQYGSSPWGGTQNIVRKAASGVFQWERRVHLGPRSATDPCGPCAAEESKGWVPVGVLLAIGEQTPCGPLCHCTFEYRVDEDGPIYQAGRGPLDFGVFGRAG